MPTRLGPLATSRVLSARGLARAAVEPWQPVPGDAVADESLEAFVTRRVGREAYERLIEPLLAGIYAGDGRRLSVAATFPQLREVERAHGSLVRGLRARSRATAGGRLGVPLAARWAAGARRRARAGLVATGRVTVRRHASVRAVVGPARRRRRRRARVVLDDGTLARRRRGRRGHARRRAPRGSSPARTPRWPRSSAPSRTAPRRPVTLAVDRAAVPHALDATGYVIPRVEGRDALACTFASSKWAGRAPADVALFRVFVGGAHRAELVERDDDALIAIARRELRETLGVAAAAAARARRPLAGRHAAVRAGAPGAAARIAAPRGGAPVARVAGTRTPAWASPTASVGARGGRPPARRAGAAPAGAPLAA
jgi:oxygen-dependent protoporphyrinogen oxidase